MKLPNILHQNNVRPKKDWEVGFLQALGIVIYIGFIAFLLNTISPIFSRGNIDDIFGMVAFLTIFSVSALICGLITLVYPAYLFLNKNILKGIKVIAWTAGFLAMFFVVYIICLILYDLTRLPVLPMAFLIF